METPRPHRGRAYEVHVGGEAVLRCSTCPEVSTIRSLPPNCNHEFVEKKFRQRGWRVHNRAGGANACPACIEMIKGKKVQQSKPIQPVTNPSTPQPRAATPRESRLIFEKLSEVFDEAKGQFIGNNDDRSIAIALDVPWAMVAKLREESGLIIKGDAVIIALRGEIKALREMLEGLETKINTLEKERRK